MKSHLSEMTMFYFKMSSSRILKCTH